MDQQVLIKCHQYEILTSRFYFFHSEYLYFEDASELKHNFENKICEFYNNKRQNKVDENGRT